MATGDISWLGFGNSLDADLSASVNFYGRWSLDGGDTTDLSGTGNDAGAVDVTLTADHRGVANNAGIFNGSTSYLFTSTQFTNPTVFTANAWFKTTTTAGGCIVGWGDVQYDSSSPSHDRLLYMGTDGNLNFGVFDDPGGSITYVITSPGAYNDGNWHMATMVMSTVSGMALYVDGVNAGTNANTVSENTTGWWHIGFNTLNGWPNAAGEYWPGSLDDIRIYKIALTSTQVMQLYGV